MGASKSVHVYLAIVFLAFIHIFICIYAATWNMLLYLAML